jgi:hypothetical protein
VAPVLARRPLPQVERERKQRRRECESS